ncbi:hypothetical protein Clacol_000814 [Clathrus columnatus]|uniref:Uncharacterized protein n=1 Tax=Clathrus columnatus TaxID=1419009 RepID=A0AAV5A212_9AGAM|nr:hypothetical protein Clacol_000814 [Clathrus columnatus]
MITRSTILTLISVAVFGGTLYSFINHTYLDTSDPLLAHLPHPLHTKTIFAQRSNVFNTVFVKWAWAWTSLAFLSIWVTSPAEQRTREKWFKWAATTYVWGSFVLWFFGPGLFDRLWVASGGECMIRLPDGHEPAILKIPSEYCVSRSIISPQTHPALFTSFMESNTIQATWKTSAKLYRGHDVSGHIFLLTLAVLFLHDQLQPAWRTITSGRLSNSLPYKVAVAFSTLLMSLWLFMILMTSIYWHSPFEKLSGFGTFIDVS